MLGVVLHRTVSMCAYSITHLVRKFPEWLQPQDLLIELILLQVMRQWEYHVSLLHFRCAVLYINSQVCAGKCPRNVFSCCTFASHFYGRVTYWSISVWGVLFAGYFCRTWWHTVSPLQQLDSFHLTSKQVYHNLKKTAVACDL